jgi:hypothetical protein
MLLTGNGGVLVWAILEAAEAEHGMKYSISDYTGKNILASKIILVLHVS